MPSFRARPLTWLFFIAAGCMSVVDLTQSSQQILTALILTGMVYIAGAWAAVGKAHRLARGAVMFIAPLVAALAISIVTSRREEASAVLAVALIAAAIAYVASLATKLVILASLPRTTSREDDPWWRISLTEILGWTVVTAIASAAVSKAELPEGMASELVWTVVASAIPCGVIVALFLAPRPRCDRAAIILSAIVTATWYILLSLIVRSGSIHTSYFIADFFGPGAQVLGFVALWIVCVRLDEGVHAAEQARLATPALKLHEEPLNDE